jgi:signal transduction histidine kinase
MAQGRFRRHHIVLEVDCDPAMRLRCTGTQITQVLLNLLINALYAVEASGRPDGRVRITARRTGDDVIIEVADNGVGIPAADLPRIFDPFFTRKPVGEGTGLGLSISHGLVTGHGGHIEVTSHEGSGSTFRVCLPVNGPPSART